MTNFNIRYLILISGFAWWKFAPTGYGFPLEIVLSLLVFYLFERLDKAVNPRVPQNNNIDTYLALRGSFQTGDLLAFGGSGLGAKIIRKTQSSAYSHIGMVVRLDFLKTGDRVFILEAVPQQGVALLPLSAKLRTYKGGADWFALNLNPKDAKREQLLEFLMQQLGKAYDFSDIMIFAKKTLLKFVSFHSLVEDSTRMICSELVAKALESVKLCEFENCSQVTPGQITELDIFVKPGKKLL